MNTDCGAEGVVPPVMSSCKLYSFTFSFLIKQAQCLHHSLFYCLPP